jgi:aminoglycoside phosphotransferase family enzyme
VRLNRRLAPEVYLGVVPVVTTPAGVRVEAEGDVVEWAVKMRRLPDEAAFRSQVMRGLIGPKQVAALGRRLAAFHATADTNQHVAAFGRFEVVAQAVRENLEAARSQADVTLSQAVFQRLTELAERKLRRHRPLIESRAMRGMPRDTHGDLRLDHVYLLPTADEPDRIAIIDCIEFCERFRYSDPVADMAFAFMDFLLLGRADLAWEFANAYFATADDAEGWELLPFYTAYRAAVRGKVEGLLLAEPEVPVRERAEAVERARQYWLLAVDELETA